MNEFRILLSLIFILVFFAGNTAYSEISKNLTVVQCDDSINRCIVRNSALKYGIVDKNGKQILPCVYSDIEASDYSNYIVTTKDIKMGLVNKDGSFLLKPEYLAINRYQKDGKFIIQPNWDEKFGLADMATGHIDIPAEYEMIASLANGAYKVEKNEQSGIINSEFKLIIPIEYYFISLFPGNRYYRLQKKSGTKDLYGIADKDGKFVLPVEYDWIDKNPSSPKQTVRKGNKTYIFNLKTGTLNLK